MWRVFNKGEIIWIIAILLYFTWGKVIKITTFALLSEADTSQAHSKWEWLGVSESASFRLRVHKIIRMHILIKMCSCFSRLLWGSLIPAPIWRHEVLPRETPSVCKWGSISACGVWVPRGESSSAERVKGGLWGGFCLPLPSMWGTGWVCTPCLLTPCWPGQPGTVRASAPHAPSAAQQLVVC